MLAPFPYFGAKSRVATLIWQRFGDVPNFVEPFAGSLAVLLARPDSHKWWERTETVNDLDGLLANYWRATQAEPDTVAYWADYPVSECDLHARHGWLVARKAGLQTALEGDPEYYDAKAAGWWLWGICQWIGSGWCSGEGPWHQVGGKMVQGAPEGAGTWAQLPHLGDAGRGINRKLPHLGDAGRGINRQLPHLGDAGRGINRQLEGAIGPHGEGHAEAWSQHLREMMQRLSDRLRRVRVSCGDWSRVCGPSPTEKLGITGVFLDPPYSLEAGRDMGLYTTDSGDVAHAVREWALEHGDNPLYRIALCGYEGEHEMRGWEAVAWKASGGYGSQGEGRGRENATREVVWFSRHCLGALQPKLL